MNDRAGMSTTTEMLEIFKYLSMKLIPSLLKTDILETTSPERTDLQD